MTTRHDEAQAAAKRRRADALRANLRRRKNAAGAREDAPGHDRNAEPGSTPASAPTADEM